VHRCVPILVLASAALACASVELQVGDELFVGSFAGDRILRVALEN